MIEGKEGLQAWIADYLAARPCTKGFSSHLLASAAAKLSTTERALALKWAHKAPDRPRNASLWLVEKGWEIHEVDATNQAAQVAAYSERKAEKILAEKARVAQKLRDSEQYLYEAHCAMDSYFGGMGWKRFETEFGDVPGTPGCYLPAEITAPRLAERDRLAALTSDERDAEDAERAAKKARIYEKYKAEQRAESLERKRVEKIELKRFADLERSATAAAEQSRASAIAKLKPSSAASQALIDSLDRCLW